MQEEKKKIDIRVMRTYKHLIDGILSLLSRKPFEEISVLEICEESGVHRATFYKHFVDKYDFLNFCFKSLLNEIPFENAPKDLTKDNAKQFYMDMLSNIMKFVESKKSIFRNVNDNNGSQLIVLMLTEAVSELLENRIHIRLDEGNTFSSPAPMLARFYSGGLVSLLRWWVLEGDNYSTSDIEAFISARIDELHSYYSKKNSLKQY